MIIAGFLFPRVSAIGAKAGLLFGLLFYVVMDYVFVVNLHFVHIWGIEFVLNIMVMHVVSYLAPKDETFIMQDAGILDLKPWRYAKIFSLCLVLITLIFYLVLGNV
mgnify:CR=1 FL=1